ncbi:MAG: integrase [Solimicrobium sp.]|nr:integrase [Solimicrobium sp.]
MLYYDKVLWIPANIATTRKLIGRYIGVYEYPDGYFELRADGVALPYSPMTGGPR